MLDSYNYRRGVGSLGASSEKIDYFPGTGNHIFPQGYFHSYIIVVPADSDRHRINKCLEKFTNVQCDATVIHTLATD